MDYTDFEKNKLRKGKALSKEDAEMLAGTIGEAGYWWKSPTPELRAERLFAAYKILREMQNERSQANLRNARLYGNVELLGFNLRDYTRMSVMPANRITLNVIASCSDTLTAKIAKTKPRPTFVGNGANFRVKKACKQLDKFTQGLFYEGQIYREAVKVFNDACVFDIGALKIYKGKDGKIKFERTWPEELFVDDVDGMYGRPRQLIQRRIVAKEVLRKEFGDSTELQAAISAVKQPPEAYVHGFGDVSEVFEAWHLPSAPGADDGIHVISIQGKELFSEPWKRDHFPFAFLRYSDRMLGFWGQSLTERLAGIQIEINRLLRSVSEQLRRKGRGRIFVPIGSKVVSAHITNNICDIVYFNGPTPPVVDSKDAVAAEEFLQLDRLYQRAFQEAGISELSAQAKKPSGLDAAVAIREYQDVESDRFVMVGKSWENLFLDSADVAIDLVRDDGGEYRTTYPDSRRSTRTVNWKDIDLAREDYTMEMFPISALPTTPAYRMQRITEMEAKGYIDHATAERLLDFPDIDAENNLMFAAVDDVDQLISNILDEPTMKYEAPDEFTNVGILVTRVSAAYLRAKHQEGIEKERLEALVQLVDDAKAMLPPPPQPAMPGPGGPPGAPPGPAGGPPLGPEIGGSINVNAAPPVAPVAPPIAA